MLYLYIGVDVVKLLKIASWFLCKHELQFIEQIWLPYSTPTLSNNPEKKTLWRREPESNEKKRVSGRERVPESTPSALHSHGNWGVGVGRWYARASGRAMENKFAAVCACLPLNQIGRKTTARRHPTHWQPHHARALFIHTHTNPHTSQRGQHESINSSPCHLSAHVCVLCGRVRRVVCGCPECCLVRVKERTILT